MKNLEDMNINDLCDYIAGDLIMAIGRGEFKSRVNVWVGWLLDKGKHNGL